ncbi:glycosyltransferase family 4 protein [Leucobacter chromiisoli]|uniref:glycosyltransferase family 4 protein n=1 Tax=Leucobacter chromiisoli TaxID=2796471 RepID=UPI00190877A3|nr:glycosyltransferase family 4 protein [Leucobacter chromiisoli]
MVVTPWFPSLLKPAAGIFVKRDVDLLQTNHEVTVLHLAEHGDLGADEPLRMPLDSGATLIRQRFDPMNPVSLLKAVSSVRELLQEADAVHSMAMHALMPVRLARPRVPWVHTEHWSALIRRSLPIKKRIGLALYRSSLSRPDAVVAVGETLANAAERYTGARVEVIPNHVPLGTHGHLPQVPEARGEAPLRLVAVGSMLHHKGPLESIDTLNELRRLGVAATLTWIGTGPLEHEMRHKAEQLGLREALVLPGHVAPEEIPEALRQAHVFILPTSFETFGVAIAEALGQGLPVVTAGYGGHLDFTPPEASRIVTQRTGAALASAVVSLISDENRWSPEQILEYALERFSDHQRELAYSSVYRRIT